VRVCVLFVLLCFKLLIKHKLEYNVLYFLIPCKWTEIRHIYFFLSKGRGAVIGVLSMSECGATLVLCRSDVVNVATPVVVVEQEQCCSLFGS